MAIEFSSIVIGILTVLTGEHIVSTDTSITSNIHPSPVILSSHVDAVLPRYVVGLARVPVLKAREYALYNGQ